MQYYMILATGGKMIIKASGVIHCYKHVIPSRFIAAKPYASSRPNDYIDRNKHKDLLFMNQKARHFILALPSFSWSIFIRAVIDHMICYNLNWPKIKL